MKALIIILLAIQVEYCLVTERKGKKGNVTIEYANRTEKSDSSAIIIINKMSKKGWETISHSTENVPPYVYHYYVLKKEK